MFDEEHRDAHDECRHEIDRLGARVRELELGLQNYMDACAYADKETLVAAIGAAHKEAVRLLPKRVSPSPALLPQATHPGAVDVRQEGSGPSVMERKVTVCDACETAACWQGSFMCDYADLAGTKEFTVAELHATPRGENAEYWFKDGNGVIDQQALAAFRASVG